MNLKRVSFKVAKAIKDAGYPQGHTGICYDKKGALCDWCKADGILDAPFIMEVWIWLWREKDIPIDVEHIIDNKVGNFLLGQRVFSNGKFQTDPEESIEKAIEYLVDNNLIK